MSEVFPHFTKDNPCIGCGKWDWTCRYGDKGYICMRAESSMPMKDGGWFHFYDGEKRKPIYIPPKRIAPKVNLDFESLHLGALSVTNNNFWTDCGRLLGVDWICCLNLQFVKWHGEIGVPMRDGENKIIGIHLRCDDGSKKAVLGSRNGLFIPQIDPQTPAYICEGASNCAALLTTGYFAIGRPSCNSGGDMLKVCLKRLGIKRVAIVADNDCVKVNGTRPGQDGAKKLKKELGLPSVIFTTPAPIKDVRQLLIKVGAETAKRMIDDSVSQKIWTCA